jgi:3-oxoacyl-[acyl-carrier protein] reductase
VARTLEEIEATAREALQAGAPQALALRGDVTNESDIEAISWQLDDRFGRADVLVNHVGGGTHFLSQYDPGMRKWASRSSGPPFWDMPSRWFEEVLRLNVMSTFLFTKAMAQRFFLRQKSGSVINSTSVHSATVFPVFGTVPYGTAKAALNHLTRIMAQELKGFNVAVNAIFIPLIRAGATEGTYWELTRETAGGWYRPEVVTPLAIHLARQDAQGVTGQVIDCLEWIEANGFGPREKWKIP